MSIGLHDLQIEPILFQKVLYQRWVESQEHRAHLDERLRVTQEHHDMLQMVLDAAAQPSLTLGLFIAPHPLEVLRVMHPELYLVYVYLTKASKAIVLW